MPAPGARGVLINPERRGRNQLFKAAQSIAAAGHRERPDLRALPAYHVLEARLRSDARCGSHGQFMLLEERDGRFELILVSDPVT